MAAQGAIGDGLVFGSLGLYFDDDWYHLMIRAYENPLVSLNKAGYQNPYEPEGGYVKGGVGWPALIW